MEQVSFRLLPQEGPYDFSKFESNFEKMTKYEKISHILVFRVYIREMSLSEHSIGKCIRNACYRYEHLSLGLVGHQSH